MALSAGTEHLQPLHRVQVRVGEGEPGLCAIPAGVRTAWSDLTHVHCGPMVKGALCFHRVKSPFMSAPHATPMWGTCFHTALDTGTRQADASLELPHPEHPEHLGPSS